MRLAQTSKDAPPSGVEVKKAHRLWEPTLQAVRTVANAPHRKYLRARVQPGCTTKRYAIKQGLELTSLPVTSWRRFARDLHDGRVEQICILSDVERMKCEAEELKQLVAEGVDALSAKSKKERFDEQSWDSLKSSLFYEVLREYRDVLPDDIPAELPQDKGVQHEIDLVPGTKYCVTR
ncbi:hypothetical protein PR003_g34977, partial [Phytophthora rubi]